MPGEQRVLRRRGRRGRSGRRRRGAPSGRRSGRPGRSRRGPRRGRRAAGRPPSSRTRRPASPHSSPATVSRMPGTSRTASTRRSMPLYSRTIPRESSRTSRSSSARSARGWGSPPGRCGGRSSSLTRVAPSSVASRACSSEWHDDRVDPLEEAAHQLPVAGPGLVRQDVVADDDRARPAAGGARRPADAGGAQQGEVGGHHRGDDVDDDDDVDVAQPPAGAHPGVGTGPREHAQRPRERLDVGRAAGDRLLPGVEHRRVEVAPRHERDVVPGLGQLVRQRRRVRGDPALEGVRRPDDGDRQLGRRFRRAPGSRGHGVRHRRGTARRGRRAARARRS